MKTEVKLPEIADNVVSGYLSRVLVQVGDVIEKDQSIIEIETDKAATDIPSPIGGEIVDIKVNKGDEIRVGQTILVVETEQVESDAKPASDKPQPEPEKQKPEPEKQKPLTVTPQPEEATPATSKLVPASPTVRRLARELGVDIAKVKGTGHAGRITDADVKAFTKQLINSSLPSTTTEYAEVPDFSQWGSVAFEPMSRIRQITAESTVRSWQTIPQVVQFDKADITGVEQFRQIHRTRVEKAGGKLTMTAILLKVSAMALREFPKFNASVDMKNRQIIYKDYVHIGIAVDTEQGLLVPVVRDVDKKSITALSAELNELAERARNRKLTSEEMQGGNFTISNLGGIGGTAFTPIVYPHQVAILGVSRSAMEQVYRDGEFVARNMLPLSLSYDHRLIDGADGARFLVWIAQALEQPLTMLL
ncbi:MAG: 2-oxo acid dehydrogenase subunit E2 [Bacteroidales bacterium]|jgi:pyruvate dehydrogenase E2 component (dihydrolipoamide acetyltransferase)|nr:2-oxo acid dehydrogenase subunit E2 [Bacteroidales bacterium]MDD2812711.1 2-oxo acid dehydrogenase subunit E2 [Bacteroidales bacterium]MDD3385602.1 2-oxo acid dehydrogenase subunit E2 [Bacteroidales bacterium]MDD3871596.1 2-oxo acid dehydrogenase subunit E2 [Bacteroidales bacterium]MDD4812432.1 2-oxo acid dehydrogenase subunit E2 [Bacteroidales bacterium]